MNQLNQIKVKSLLVWCFRRRGHRQKHRAWVLAEGPVLPEVVPDPLAGHPLPPAVVAVAACPKPQATESTTTSKPD
jgi:hypothetical protein